MHVLTAVSALTESKITAEFDFCSPFHPQVAKLLMDIGDKIDKDVQDSLKEAFENQFKVKHVFQMAYDGFSKTCISFLARTKSKISTGWDQLYILAYGGLAHGLEHKKGGEGSPDCPLACLAERQELSI